VKQWMVATFGNSKPIVRWPKRMLQKMPELAQHNVSTITKAALTKYPALATWGQPLRTVTYGWADLMWIESTVMQFTMLELKREHQIPSLSVHDSLIVQARGADTARTVLEQKFHYQRGVTPLLKINWPEPSQAARRNQGEEDREGRLHRYTGNAFKSQRG
jgi:hypothetical protein